MKWFMPVLTGLLLAASFPKIQQGYLAWIALIPLIIFIRQTNRPGKAFAGGFIAGFVHLLLLQLWIPDVLMQYGGLSPVLAWAGYALELILLSLFFGVACLLTNLLIRRGGDPYIFSFPFILIAMEYLQNFIPFGGYPWNLIGYSQSNYRTLIQIADWTGVYGVSFLTLFFNASLLWIFLRFRGGIKSVWPFAASLCLIAFSLVYGTIALHRWDAIQPSFHAVMLQGNVSFNDSTAVLEENYRTGYLKRAEQLDPAGMDLLIIPESPSPIMYQYDPEYRRTCDALAKKYSMGLVFNNNREERGQFFNSAYFINHKGELADVYDKMHLVPFGEYIPLKKSFQFIRTISKDVSEYSRGRSYRVVRLGGRPANAVICFEMVFPGLVRRFVRQGSQLMLNLTNDGWYGDSSAPYQHLAIARWRAIENRRYLLRATNSGVSAVIEPTGRIQQSTGILKQAVCRGRFAFIETQTFYTRYGDIFVFVCVIIACGFLALALSRRKVDSRRMD
jgi:apolipoprotein N-acyltransferase